MPLTIKTATDVGLKRTQNEDSAGFWIEETEASRRGALLVVADGMGGARAGEVASRLAVDSVMSTYREEAHGDILADLAHSLEVANRIVHEHGVAHPDLNGMGTTCTAVVVRDREVYLAHVGDSRAYLLRNGSIRQLTQDHTLVAQLVLNQQITPEQAKVDPRRNLVTRSVGVGSFVEVDAERLPEALGDGDAILICTDGLHGLVDDEEIAWTASGADLDVACAELIQLAKERGGHDNITLLIARYDTADQDAGAPPAGSRGAGEAR